MRETTIVYAIVIALLLISTVIVVYKAWRKTRGDSVAIQIGTSDSKDDEVDEMILKDVAEKLEVTKIYDVHPF